MPSLKSRKRSKVYWKKQLTQNENTHYYPLQVGCLSEIPFIFMTSSMIQSFKNNRYKLCRHILVETHEENKQKHKYLSLIICLKSNLQPEILSIGAGVKSYKISSMIQEQLELLKQNCGFIPQSFICQFTEMLKKNTLKLQFLESYSVKNKHLTSVLINNQVRKHPYIHKQMKILIRELLQSTSVIRNQQLIKKIQIINYQGYMEYTRNKKIQLLSDFPTKCYEFYYRAIYETRMCSLANKLSKKFDNGLCVVIDYLLRLQQQSVNFHKNYIDTFNVSQMNSQIWNLNFCMQAQPFSCLVQNYLQSRSLKFKKLNSNTYKAGGKAGQSYEIVKVCGLWECSCQMTEKIGIPCKHIIKIYLEEQIPLYHRIHPRYLLREQNVKIDDQIL